MSKLLQDPTEARTFSKAWSKGYSEGMAAARRAATAEAAQAAILREHLVDGLNQQAAQQQAAVTSLLAQLRNAEAPRVQEAVDLALDAAFSIASSILGIALDDERTRALSVAARAGAHGSRGLIELRVSPDDHQMVSGMGLEVAVIADSTLSRGDFKASYPDGWIDGVLEGAANRAAEEAVKHVSSL